MCYLFFFIEAGLRRFVCHLQEENQELKDTLGEYEKAVDVIMSKYRSQITSLSDLNVQELNDLKTNMTSKEEENEELRSEVVQLRSKMEDMTKVMAMAAFTEEIDTEQDLKFMERLCKENEQLREIMGDVGERS